MTQAGKAIKVIKEIKQRLLTALPSRMPKCLSGHKPTYPVPTTMRRAVRWEGRPRGAAAVRAPGTVPALGHQPQRRRAAPQLREKGEEI